MTIDANLLKSFSLEMPISHTRLAGGANNCVHQLTYSDRKVVLKQYFQHPTDVRERLASEYSFLKYAWEIGLRCIPEPIACARVANAALYSYIEGCVMTEPLQTDVQQAIEFFLSLNQTKELKGLQDASEACFSIQEHRELINRRVERLISYQQEELAPFINQLVAKWTMIQKTLSSNTPLDASERCISPSDFGFHNALLQANGQIIFFDFEYAGWDDPAKAVCDFFCQPRIPIPRDFFTLVSHAFASTCANPEKTLERIHLLFPAYQIKWCCILLNCFSPLGQLRSHFAASNEQKKLQLEKAQLLLDRL